MHDIAKLESSKVSKIIAAPVMFTRRMWRRPIVKALVGVFLLLVAIVGIKKLQINKMQSSPMMMPPATVSTVPVKEEDWAPILPAVGTISAVQGATVSAELAGTVAEIKFQNGGVARQGDVLMKLDASSEEAQLRSSEADLELARADFERARDLAARNVVSKAELDSAESRFKQKEGIVGNMRSMISKKEVRAPFDGQLGIRLVNVGQMITAGQQVVSLQALEPLYVDFALPQQYLSRLSEGLDVHVQTDVMPGQEFVGKLTALNSSVDPVTRNVALQATLDNRDRSLRPGMFAKVEVVLPEKHKSLVIPGTAISYAPYGDSVFVVEKKKDDKTGQESLMLRQAFVRIGEARGDFVAINQGLKPEEIVVSTGVFKLRNGMPVVINNDLAPKPQLNPKPPDT